MFWSGAHPFRIKLIEDLDFPEPSKPGSEPLSIHPNNGSAFYFTLSANSNPTSGQPQFCGVEYGREDLPVLASDSSTWYLAST